MLPIGMWQNAQKPCPPCDELGLGRYTETRIPFPRFPRKLDRRNNMKKLSLLSVTMTLVFTAFAITNSAKAELINRGGGLIYDTDINVTWLQDANYAKTSDYDTDGDMLYSQANAFIAYLNSISFLGYSNWRLPKADPSCSNPGGYDCTNSEMGHLSYTELGNTSAELATHSGPFTNLCLLCIYL
jgi:hypothetical protein